jgi:(p)ppGpp synthase/HD superfamily hydrolase
MAIPKLKQLSENRLLAIAISIVADAFKYKVDKSGEPYILHCLYVMYKQTTVKRKIIAILHDLVEDTEWEFDDLRNEGFGDEYLDPLKLLTHDPLVKSYDEYIRDISTNKDATAVKLADLEHNSQPFRLKGLTKSDHARIEKYHRSYVYLSKI